MNLLYLTVLFPLLGYVILSLSRGRLSENLAAAVGVGSLFLAAFTTAWVGYHFLTTPTYGGVYTQTLWTWINVDGFKPQISFHLDGLSLTMLGVIIGVNLQTSFLTPPFGFALFYLRGVAPPEIKTTDIYRGVVPFVALQVIGLTLTIAFPQIVRALFTVFRG